MRVLGRRKRRVEMEKEGDKEERRRKKNDEQRYRHSTKVLKFSGRAFTITEEP